MNEPKLRHLTNGMRLVTVPCEAESVAVGIFIGSGSRNEAAATAGISHFIEHMLFKGTPTRSTLDISRAIEGRGGTFNACTGEESTCYYAHLPKEHLGDAVDILSDMYLNASINEEEFAREKQVVIEEIKMYADEPDQVACENLQRAIFPKSMLGAPIAGSPKSLAPMTAALMRKYIASHYLASNTIVVVVGDFDGERAYDIVNRALGKMRRREMPLAFDRALAGRVVGETKTSREVNQTQLALGYRTFGVHDRRKYAATVMDAILGRGMSSRLFQEVREKRGLSYDISSRMQFFQDAGMFTVTAGMDPSKADLAIKTIDREIKRICEKKLSASELRRTKEFLTGNFRLSHERVTSKLFFYGQTMLAFGRLMKPSEQVVGVSAVSADEIRDTARAIFRPSARSVSWVVPK